MASHNETGRVGEEMAINWLLANGYTILERNWRYSYYEIDIVALKNNKLHFIEVKCRNYSSSSHPEDSVTRKKFKRLQRAADHYLFQHPGHRWVQYDVLAITLFRDKTPEFFFIEDVYMR